MGLGNHDAASKDVILKQLEEDHHVLVDEVLLDLVAIFVHVDLVVEKDSLVGLHVGLVLFE